MTLEEAFLQIRQATGVSTPDEMVEKFLNQGANKKAFPPLVNGLRRCR